MSVRYVSDENHRETASYMGWFTGRKKARIHLGASNDNTKSIALEGEQIFTKEELAKERKLLRKWVALRIDDGTNRETYVKVNESSLQKRFDLSSKELKECTQGAIFDLGKLTSNETKRTEISHLLEKREGLDKVTLNGNTLKDLSQTCKQDFDIISEAVKKNPEAIQYISDETFGSLGPEKQKEIVAQISTRFSSLSPDLQAKICQEGRPWTPLLPKPKLNLQKETYIANPQLLKSLSISDQRRIVRKVQHDKQQFPILFSQLPIKAQVDWTRTAPTVIMRKLPSSQQQTIIQEMENENQQLGSEPALQQLHECFKSATQEAQLAIVERNPKEYFKLLPANWQHFLARKEPSKYLEHADPDFQRALVQADPDRYLRHTEKSIRISFGQKSMFYYMKLDSDDKAEANRLNKTPVFTNDKWDPQELVPTLLSANASDLHPRDWEHIEKVLNPKLLKDQSLDPRICNIENSWTTFIFPYTHPDFQRERIKENISLLQFATDSIQLMAFQAIDGSDNIDDDITHGEPNFVKYLSPAYQRKTIDKDVERFLKYASSEIQHQYVLVNKEYLKHASAEIQKFYLELDRETYGQYTSLSGAPIPS